MTKKKTTPSNKTAEKTKPAIPKEKVATKAKNKTFGPESKQTKTKTKQSGLNQNNKKTKLQARVKNKKQ